jgi:hypothetical protein
MVHEEGRRDRYYLRNAGVCDKFVGNDRSNEPRRGEIFIVQRPKKERHDAPVGLGGSGGEASFYKDAASTRLHSLQAAQACISGNNPQICRTPGTPLDITGL